MALEDSLAALALARLIRIPDMELTVRLLAIAEQIQTT